MVLYIMAGNYCNLVIGRPVRFTVVAETHVEGQPDIIIILLLRLWEFLDNLFGLRNV